jgi:hypothetical protein
VFLQKKTKKFFMREKEKNGHSKQGGKGKIFKKLNSALKKPNSRSLRLF